MHAPTLYFETTHASPHGKFSEAMEEILRDDVLVIFSKNRSGTKYTAVVKEIGSKGKVLEHYEGDTIKELMKHLCENEFTVR